jgi:hypothetical protein
MRLQIVLGQHSPDQLSHLAQVPAGAQTHGKSIDRVIWIAHVSEPLITHRSHQVLAEVLDL